MAESSTSEVVPDASNDVSVAPVCAEKIACLAADQRSWLGKTRNANRCNIHYLSMVRPVEQTFQNTAL